MADRLERRQLVRSVLIRTDCEMLERSYVVDGGSRGKQWSILVLLLYRDALSAIQHCIDINILAMHLPSTYSSSTGQFEKV